MCAKLNRQNQFAKAKKSIKIEKKMEERLSRYKECAKLQIDSSESI